MIYDDLSNAGFSKAARAAEFRQRRLIAAAPNLLAALKKIESLCEIGQEFSGATQNALHIARAAIAKAEGTS